jgi:uncharacterized protein YciI
MFVVLGTYVRPWARTDEIFDRHRAFMQEQMAQGRFLCSGPRDGGSVIVAYGDDEPGLRAALAEDPFAAEGYVTFEVYPFHLGLADPASSLAELAS